MQCDQLCIPRDSEFHERNQKWFHLWNQNPPVESDMILRVELEITAPEESEIIPPVESEIIPPVESGWNHFLRWFHRCQIRER